MRYVMACSGKTFVSNASTNLLSLVEAILVDITFDMIAKVHGVPITNVQKSFTCHQDRFTQGKHVYRLDYAEASQNGLGVLSNPNGVRRVFPALPPQYSLC